MAGSPQKVNIREYIDQQVAERLDQAAIETRLRESVEAIVLEVLAEHQPGAPAAPAVIDIGVIRDVVRDELEAAGGQALAPVPTPALASAPTGLTEDQVRAIVAEAAPASSAADEGGGAAGLGLNELRKLVAEMIEAAMGDELDATRAAAVDPEAVRAIVREELAGAAPGGGGLDADAVRAIVQEELVGVPLGAPPAAGADESQVRDIVADVLRAEAGTLVGKVRETVQRLVGEAHRALLDGPELGEKLAAAAATRGGGGLEEIQVRELIAQGFIERLPAGGFDAFVTRDEAAAMVAERATAGPASAPAGEESGGGLTRSDVKALVKDLIAVEAPTRDEFDKLEQRAKGGSGGGLAEKDVRDIVAEALAVHGEGGEAGGGGGLAAGDVRKLIATAIEDAGAPSLEDIRALVAAEIRAAGTGGEGGGVDEDAVRAIVREAVAEAGGGGGAGTGGLDEDAVRQLVADAVQAAVAANGGGGGGGGAAVVGTSGISVEQFLNSPAMKEALEDRFRLMQTYIKSDLVPKLVQKALEEKA